jgi:hypothetical protein
VKRVCLADPVLAFEGPYGVSFPICNGREKYLSALSSFPSDTHRSPLFLATMANCVDVILVILLIFAICVDLCGVAAIVWYLVGLPNAWQNWILSFYALFFCFVQVFIEIVYPQSNDVLGGVFSFCFFFS